MKILVADDDPVSRRLMQGMLERSGYEVIVAADGLIASEILTAPDGPKLALIDWMMPGLDGLGVCRAVRRRHDESYIYILLLTSKESSEDIVEGLEAGADDYLTKPCHPAELKARLLTGRRILQLEDKLVEAREAMRFRATHDGLTRLWNRSMILAHLRTSLDRAARVGGAVGVLLCDVDHFKRVNDVHGHLAGDEVLEQVATRLHGAVRGEDRVGRYGGEEFLVVLQGCRAEDLAKRAEHVRQAVVHKPFHTHAGQLTVSVSIGAHAFPGAGVSASFETMVKQADEALYQAKADGRNRVCLVEAAVMAH